MSQDIHCRACTEEIQHGFLCDACLRLHTSTQSQQLAEFILDHHGKMETLAIVLYNACAQLAVLHADALCHLQPRHLSCRSDEQLKVFANRLQMCAVAMGNVLAKVPIEVLVALQNSKPIKSVIEKATEEACS